MVHVDASRKDHLESADEHGAMTYQVHHDKMKKAFTTISAEGTKASFRLKDHNGDGKISIEEHDHDMMKWIRGLADDAIKNGDKNHDGVLDKEEFLAIQAEL
jgi:Ca2+-binding EF-hand superfamily protein